MSGYHTKEIEKGILGEFSKIREEFEEFLDGYEQEDTILSLCELSDMVGATEKYLSRYNINFDYIIYGCYECSSFKKPDFDIELPIINQIKIWFNIWEKETKRLDIEKINDEIYLICVFYYFIDLLIAQWSVDLRDLKKFSDKTISSFESGKRK